jgi:hypothetical protein
LYEALQVFDILKVRKSFLNVRHSYSIAKRQTVLSYSVSTGIDKKLTSDNIFMESEIGASAIFLLSSGLQKF